MNSTSVSMLWSTSIPFLPLRHGMCCLLWLQLYLDDPQGSFLFRSQNQYHFLLRNFSPNASPALFKFSVFQVLLTLTVILPIGTSIWSSSVSLLEGNAPESWGLAHGRQPLDFLSPQLTYWKTPKSQPLPRVSDRNLKCASDQITSQLKSL